ncbi:hypothetical protein [Microcoleus sp. MON2_D5]|uniref:hypothetical protein n=1 Tax=Microcoleus sp. MON2_D5 TaxID=2818833 RepID=UPI002FD37027
MSKSPMVSHRRIDQLRQLAYDCNLTNEQAKTFGKLTATATWEKLLTSYGLEFDHKPRITSIDGSTVSNENSRQINLLEWVDLGQAFALALASVGFALLILGLWPKINPLNLFPPVKIQIQIGQK